jgi:hypothetical protein
VKKRHGASSGEKRNPEQCTERAVKIAGARFTFGTGRQSALQELCN